MKKRFAFLLIGIIVLMGLTFALQMIFNEQTKKFGISCGELFLSIFCLFCYKNALNPTSRGLGCSINMTKNYYEKNAITKVCKIARESGLKRKKRTVGIRSGGA